MRNQQKLFLSDCDDGIINTCVHSTNFPTKTSSLWFPEHNRFPFDLILAILQTKLAKFWRRIKGGLSLRAQSRSFERRICAQTQDLQIFKGFICLKWIVKKLSTTLHTQFNYYVQNSYFWGGYVFRIGFFNYWMKTKKM